jgi:thiol-disulfide isomerase/thioredoxin
MVGVLVLVGTLVLATAAGLVLRARNGRVRVTAGSTLPADVRALVAPAGVTLVQLSTTFCAPCRHARVLLSDLAARTDGLHHAELDVTDRPELARELSILRTPTTLAISGDGAELLRVGGVPKRDELLAALTPHLSAHSS